MCSFKVIAKAYVIVAKILTSLFDFTFRFVGSNLYFKIDKN